MSKHLDPHGEQRDRLMNKLRKLHVWSPSKSHQDLEGETEVKYAVERLAKLVQMVPETAIQWMPGRQLDSLNTTFDQIEKALEATTDFYNSRRLFEARSQHCKMLYGTYDQAWDVLAPMCVIGSVGSTAIQQAERIVEQFPTQISRLEQIQAAGIDKARSEFKQLLAQSVAAGQANRFSTAARSSETSARTWLIVSAVLTVLLVAVAVSSPWLSQFYPTPESVYDSVQIGLAKVLVVGAIGSFAILSSKSYFASRHNAVVNRHRENALQTFELVAKAAETEASRDAILAAAADAIFRDQPTGFSSTDTSEGNGASLLRVGSMSGRF